VRRGALPRRSRPPAAYGDKFHVPAASKPGILEGPVLQLEVARDAVAAGSEPLEERMRKEISSDSRSANGLNERIRRMELRHRELDNRIEELGKRALLTPTEQREISELKKHKLLAKDQIAAMKRGVA
jgi:uncharacterized protein YdcH (DUF465 family)